MEGVQTRGNPPKAEDQVAQKGFLAFPEEEGKQKDGAC